MFPIRFSVNPWSIFFLVLTLPPWIAAFVFSLRYIQKKRVFFFSFFSLTFLANIAIFFGSDFLTILILYELLSLSSIPLVFYEKTKEAIEAGKIYFFFSLLSGLLVFAGTMMLSITKQSPPAYLLMSVGFLVKCGAYPFHVWLPKAHPVAPSPASAILSGCIIKVGFYGLFRVILEWKPSHEVGLLLLGISIVTMFYGVLQALFQTNAKKMLAYHSVSQMGYILLGLAMFVISKESVPLTGSLMHAMNHAFFKSALFLAIGILYLDSHTYDMYKMQGYLKKYPFVSILFFIAILGITGAPFFNGFVSKTFIHEELLLEKAFIFKFTETIFLLTAIGTFVSNFKMYYLINFRAKPFCISCKPRFREIFPLFILGLCILGFGMFPLLETKILPLNLLPHIDEVLEEIIPFHHLFVENLAGFLWIAMAGLSLIVIGLKWEWYHKKIPIYVDPLFWYQLLYRLFNVIFIPIFLELEIKLIYFYSFMVRRMNRFMQVDELIEKAICQRYRSFYQNQIKKLIRQNQWELRMNQALQYAIVSEKSNVCIHSSHFLDKGEVKIQTIYQEMVQLFKFLFTLSNKQEIKSSKSYEIFVEKKGKKMVIVLLVLVLFFTISFVIFFRYFPI